MHAPAQERAFELADAWRLPLLPPSPAAVETRNLRINPEVIRADATTLRLPLFDAEVVAHRSAAQEIDGQVSWQGLIGANPDRADPDHQVSLTYDGVHLAGYLSTASGVYEIAPTAQGNVLMKLDSARFPPCSGGIHPHIKAAETLLKDLPAPIEAVNGGAPSVMEMLVVFASDSVTAMGGQAAARTFAQQAIDSANLAYSNSQMTVRMRLAGVRFPARAGSGNLDTDLTWLQADPTVARWRDDVGADMVGLIVESPGCGLGYVMGAPSAGFAPFAFQVSARGCAVGNLTFAHEHGHNMGMLHNPKTVATTALLTPTGTTSMAASEPS